MAKEFQKWHIIENVIETLRTPQLYSEGEIWWCSIGINIGVEEDGKNELCERPVLVFHKFNRNMFWAIPLTSLEKTGPNYYQLTINDKKVTALLSQLTLLSAKRLNRRVGRIGDDTFIHINDAIIQIILSSRCAKPADDGRVLRAPKGDSDISIAENNKESNSV